jgi:hypothetical protein
VEKSALGDALCGVAFFCLYVVDAVDPGVVVGGDLVGDFVVQVEGLA